MKFYRQKMIKYLKACSHEMNLNLKNKSVFYGCDLLSSQSMKGKTYDELAKTYQITFVAYTVFPDISSYINEFMLRDTNGNILTKELTITFIELSKLKETIKKPVETMTALEMWSVFFEYADDSNHRELINQMISVKEEINMASALLQSIGQDDYEKARLMSRRKFQTDMESDRLTVIRNAKYEIAQNSLKENLDIDIIKKITGLDEFIIKKLQAELEN